MVQHSTYTGSSTEAVPSAPPAGGRRSSARASGAAGMGSVLAVVASFTVLPADAGGSASQDIVRRYSEGSGGYLRATVLQSLSVGLFCLFLAGLCLTLWRRGSRTAPVGAVVGGVVLATCQLLGYAVIATLAYGVAERGDDAVVMALYDLSSVLFVVGNVGLAVLCGATGAALLRSRDHWVIGWSSIALAALATVAASSYASGGAMSVHGDVGFVVVLLQLVWVSAVSSRLLLRGTSTVGHDTMTGPAS